MPLASGYRMQEGRFWITSTEYRKRY